MKNCIFIVGLLLPLAVFAQNITGKVINEKNEGLMGANVYLVGTSIGTSTDQNGWFGFSSGSDKDVKLVVSFIGYQADTIEVSSQSFTEILLVEAHNLSEVIVKHQRDGVVISNLTPIKTEQITQTELAKAACCDLAGCFETQVSVQVQTSNVITNSKELRLLGLSGVYNQVLIDGFPMFQGLTNTYSVSSIPGTIVGNIYVSKGANSVLQGFESIAGQINVETRDPDNTDRLLFNAYMNSFKEKHFNLNYAFKKNNWSNLSAFHTVQPADKRDRDDDNFLDLPLLTRYMFLNKWKYGNEQEWGWNSEVAVRFLNEKREGGQTNFDSESDIGSTSVYGQLVKINQPEFWSKTGFRMNDNHNFSFFASGFHQAQNSYFGTVKYDANQTNLYLNAQYEWNYSSHNLKTGVSFRHLDLDEDISFTSNTLDRTYAGEYSRTEYIPGMFAENTAQFLEGKLSWITGLRIDHHNDFGIQITPRSLLKYDLTPTSSFRANIGRGWRTVNLFSENINLLVSSRDIIFEEDLVPEKALNYGINYTQKFESSNLSGYFSADFYRTEFQNQIFPDYDSDPSLSIIKNFTGQSVGNGFQTDLFIKFWQELEVKIAYNYLDVYRITGDSKIALPFNSKDKIFTSFSYKPVSNKFHLDMNAHWYGKQRMPNTQSNPSEYRRPDFSEEFVVVNSQFTYNFKDFELYIGCENIFNFRQERPIISWQNPFSLYFDTSSVWGPTRGREYYLGFRYYVRAN